MGEQSEITAVGQCGGRKHQVLDRDKMFIAIKQVSESVCRSFGKCGLRCEIISIEQAHDITVSNMIGFALNANVIPMVINNSITLFSQAFKIHFFTLVEDEGIFMESTVNFISCPVLTIGGIRQP